MVPISYKTPQKSTLSKNVNKMINCFTRQEERKTERSVALVQGVLFPQSGKVPFAQNEHHLKPVTLDSPVMSGTGLHIIHLFVPPLIHSSIHPAQFEIIDGCLGY